MRPGELLPQVFLRRLERQGHALALEVDVEHLDLDLLADGDLAGMVDVLPGQLGDVHESVDAAEVDERAEVHDRRDDTGAHTWRLLQGLREGRGTSDCDSSRKARRDSTTLLRLRSSSMIFASSSWPTNGCRSRTRRRSTSEAGEESAQADVEDEAALDDFDDTAGDDSVFLLIFSFVPQARSYYAPFLDRIK